MLTYFVKHRLAANILMVIMLVAGVIAMQKMPVSMFPNIEISGGNFSVSYDGASTEVLSNDVAYPLTESIKQIEGVDSVGVYVSSGRLQFNVDFEINGDSEKIIKDIQSRLDQFNWNDGVDVPTFNQYQVFEPVGFYILTVDGDVNTLREFALKAKKSLVSKGLVNVFIDGNSSVDINWKPELQTWLSLNLNPNELVQSLNSQHSKQSAGMSGGQSLVIGEELGSSREISQLTIEQAPISKIHNLEDLSQTPSSLFVEGKPALILVIQRPLSMGTVEAGEIVDQWKEQFNAQYKDVANLAVFFDVAEFVQSFMDLLTENAFIGLLLVLLTLFVLLNGRVAIWTAAGIPIAIFAMFGLLYLIDGNINIFTILALLIALGIVVDDAIVVSEETLSLKQKGMNAADASIHAVKRMFAPVTAAALTSIAAFSPLLFLPGETGALLKSVPIVIICVLIASLFECFFVLPGHLNHSLEKQKEKQPSRLRLYVDGKFESIRNKSFRKLISMAAHNRLITTLSASAFLIVSVMMIVTSTIKFDPTMGVEFDFADLYVTFYEDVSDEDRDKYTQYLIGTLKELQKNKPNLVKMHFYKQEKNRNRLAVTLGLYKADERFEGWSNAQIMDYWKEMIVPNEWVEELSASTDEADASSGSNAKFVSFNLYGDDLNALKQATQEIKRQFSDLPFLSDVKDNFRSNSTALNIKANLLAKQLGMDDRYILNQANDWLNDKQVFEISRGDSIGSFKIGVDKDESWGLEQLNRLPIRSPEGEIYTLEQLTVQVRENLVGGFYMNNGRISVSVQARINDENYKVNDVSSLLNKNIVGPIKDQFGINAEFSGSAQDVVELMISFVVSAAVAMLLIFLILAWLFQSWVWPFAVVVAIPFSMTGAILGHWLMGAGLTPLSVLGMFGVMGIVVNDSIILIDRFRQLIESGMGKIDAIVEASCQRFRAVLLTSITTVIGLVPILFESSVQAQIIKTMAISLAFGLLYGTLVVLVITPCVVSFMRVKHLQSDKPENSQA